MLQKAAAAGHIQGLVGHLIPGGVTHLQYADDTLLMFRPDHHSIASVKAILICFELMSGLKINFHKSDIYLFGEAKSKRNLYQEIFTCALG